MKNYIFRTTATMKEYNRCKWWIDSDIVTEKRISAETVADALEIWREQVEERHYIAVSKNAIKNKLDMLSRAKQSLKTATIIDGLNSTLIYG